MILRRGIHLIRPAILILAAVLAWVGFLLLVLQDTDTTTARAAGEAVPMAAPTDGGARQDQKTLLVASNAVPYSPKVQTTSHICGGDENTDNLPCRYPEDGTKAASDPHRYLWSGHTHTAEHGFWGSTACLGFDKYVDTDLDPEDPPTPTPHTGGDFGPTGSRPLIITMI